MTSFSFAAFQILSLAFNCLIMRYLTVYLLVYILYLEFTEILICCRLEFFITFRKVSALFLLLLFSFFFGLFLPLVSFNSRLWVCCVFDGVSMSLRQCLFFFWEYTAWGSHVPEISFSTL